MMEDRRKETEQLNPLHKKQRNQDCAENFDDLDKGWAWVTLFASFGTLFLIGNSVYATGIVHSLLLDWYGESISTTSWVGAIQSSFVSLAGPLSSLMSDKISCRAAIVLSGVFYFTGYLGTAFSPNIEFAIFTCGVLTGMGAGTGYTASLVAVGFNFKKRQNLALGIASSGMGAGVFVLAPLMQFARDYYGPMGFFLILSSVTSHIIIFGVMCFPSQLERHTQSERRRDFVRHGRSRFKIFIPYIKVSANKAMVSLFFCMICYCTGTYVIYLYFPSYAILKGFTAIQAAFLVSLSGVLSVFGRILTGILANFNRINVIIIYSGSMTIVGIASLIYPFVSDYFAGHVVFVVVLGLFFGSCYVTITPVSLKFVGINYIAVAIGLQFFFGGIGALVGPVSAGILVDTRGSYEECIFVAGAFILLASGFGFVTLCFKQNRRHVDTRIFDLRKVKDSPHKYLDNAEQTKSDGFTTEL